MPGQNCVLIAFVASVVVLSSFSIFAYNVEGYDNTSELGDGDYGIYARLHNLTLRQDTLMRDGAMINASEGKLDMYNVSYTEACDYCEKSIMLPLEDPGPGRLMGEENIFDIINERAPFAENNDIIDFLFDFQSGLLPRPNLMNYWIYTNYTSHEVWTQGYMRSRLLLNFEGGVPHIIKDTWYGVNIDGDITTGDSEGNDIRVRLTPDFTVTDIPTLNDMINAALRGESISITLQGGLNLEVEDISGGEGAEAPFTIYVLKAISYSGKNNIIALGLEFPQVPESFTGRMIVSSIKLGNILKDAIENIINGGIAEIGNASILEALSGPYILRYLNGEQMGFMNITVGMAQLVQSSGGHMALETNEVIHIDLSEHFNGGGIPASGQLWLNNEGPGLIAPIDQVRWAANCEEGLAVGGADITNVHLGYFERLDDGLTLADAQVIGLPSQVNITIDYSKVKNGKNVTSLELNASAWITSLDYYQYQIPNLAPYLGGENNTTEIYNASRYKGVHAYIKDIPSWLYVEVTSDINRDITIPPINNSLGLGIIPRIIDTTITRLITRLQRVGNNLRYLPENLMTIPSRKGFLEMRTLSGAEVGDIQFHRTMGPYLAPAQDVTYITSMNLTPYMDETAVAMAEDGVIPSVALSGHIEGVGRMYVSFENDTIINLESTTSKAFYVDSRNPHANATMRISNLPTHIKIQASEERMVYDSFGTGGVDEFEILSSLDYVNLYITARNVEGGFEIEKSNVRASVRGINGTLGKLKIYVATGTKRFFDFPYDMQAMLVNITEYNAVSYMALNELSALDYEPGRNGTLNLSLEDESPLFVDLYNTKDTGGIKSRMYINPLPNNMSIVLPGVIDLSPVNIPNIYNMSGTLDFVDIVMALGDVATGLTSLMANASQSFAASIGGMGSNMALKYTLAQDTPMTLIAEMRQNLGLQVEAPEWRHGVGINKVFSSAPEEMEEGVWARIFLTGLPPEASIRSQMTDDVIAWDIDMDHFKPDYDYLIIDTQGIRGRRIHSFIDGIQYDTDLHLSTYLMTDLGEDVGEMNGDIHLNVSRPLGSVYMKIFRSTPIPSIREVYLPSVPNRLDLKMTLSNGIDVDWKASHGLDVAYIQMTKFIGGAWHPMVTLLHDVPEGFRARVKPTTGYDFDQPAPIQGIPDISLDANEDGMDMHVVMDGAVGGQKGRMEIVARDIPKSVEGHGDGGGYTIHATGQIGYLDIKLTSLNLAREYSIGYLNIRGKDVSDMILRVKMVFGVYPYFKMVDTVAGYVRLKFIGNIDLMGFKREMRVVIADLRGGAAMPSQIHGNDLYIEKVSREEDIWLVPMPTLTLLSSMR